MARSDHGKSRQKTEIEHDSGQRGILGPFPFHLSGYAPSRNQKDWYRFPNPGNAWERARHAWEDWSSEDLRKELEPFGAKEPTQ